MIGSHALTDEDFTAFDLPEGTPAAARPCSVIVRWHTVLCGPGRLEPTATTFYRLRALEGMAPSKLAAGGARRTPLASVERAPRMTPPSDI